MKNLRLFAVSVCAAATVAVAPNAAAAPLVSPGTLMHVLPVEAQSTLKLDGREFHLTPEQNSDSCSQGAAGTLRRPDGSRVRVMLTAGHCLKNEEGERHSRPDVYVNTRAHGFQKIGVKDKIGPVMYEDEDSIPIFINSLLNAPDYGTVRLDDGVESNRLSASVDEFGRKHSRPVVLTGIRDYPKLRPLQVVWDNFGQPICKDGARTGRSCGVQVARTSDGIWSWGLNYTQGDSGGNNYDPHTGEVLGMTSMGFGNLGRAQPADTAIEQAYNIPSGTVNDHFELAQSTEPAEPVKTLHEEDQEVLASLQEQGLPPVPDFHADFQRELAASQRTAAKVSHKLQGQAAAGDAAGVAATLDSAGKQAAVHADNLFWLGVASGIEDLAF